MKNPNFTKKHYTDNYLCFQEEKINKLEKTDLIELLKDPDSWIYIIIKENCINIFFRTKGYLNCELNEDDLYSLGVNITINQIQKKYFFDINSDNDIIINRVNSRIVNNMRNFFSKKRKISYLRFQNYLSLSIDEFYDDYQQIICELELNRMNKNEIIEGLKKLWNDVLYDDIFDFYDFKYLCNNFDLDVQDVLIYRPYIVPHMIKIPINSRNYSQLALVFDFEEVA